jgi:hypothetical protein
MMKFTCDHFTDGEYGEKVDRRTWYAELRFRCRSEVTVPMSEWCDDQLA